MTTAGKFPGIPVRNGRKDRRDSCARNGTLNFRRGKFMVTRLTY